MPEKPSERPFVDAAICIVWDNECCYYWLSTRRKESHPDAIKLLIVEAMKHARKLGLNFDADDANTSGVRGYLEQYLECRMRRSATYSLKPQDGLNCMKLIVLKSIRSRGLDRP